MKVTRRELASGLLASAPAMAQAANPAQTAEEELRAQLEQTRDNAKRLAAFSVPMSTEPAFQFKP